MLETKFAHDLKAPLQGIFCCIQMMRNCPQSRQGAISRYMDMLTENALDMDRLLRNASDAEHLREGTSRRIACRKNLHTMLTEVCRQYMPIAEQHGIRFDWDFPENIYAMLDEEKMRRILQNLIINALRFTPCGGHVRVEARTDAENIRIYVSDTGCGIAEDEQGMIFNMGYTHGGEGMGLYIAREFARLHGGDIAVKSALGQGSRFCVTIPKI